MPVPLDQQDRTISQEDLDAAAAREKGRSGKNKRGFVDPSVAQSYEGVRWQTRAQDAYNQMQPESVQMWGDLQDALWKRQRGESPSAANLAMQAQLDRSAQAGAQGQGASPMLAARQGAMMGGQQGVQAAASGGVARAQEQDANRQQMLKNQMHKDNLTAQYMQAGMSAAEAERQARLKTAELTLQAEQAQQQRRANQVGLGNQIQNASLKMIGTVASMSDKTSKEKIAKIESGDFDDLLDNLQGYNFNYKKSHKPGDKDRYSGIMAQDLEKSTLGKSAVKELSVPVKRKGKTKLETVKHINIPALTKALTGAVKSLSNRLDTLGDK